MQDIRINWLSTFYHLINQFPENSETIGESHRVLHALDKVRKSLLNPQEIVVVEEGESYGIALNNFFLQHRNLIAVQPPVMGANGSTLLENIKTSVNYKIRKIAVTLFNVEASMYEEPILKAISNFPIENEDHKLIFIDLLKYIRNRSQSPIDFNDSKINDKKNDIDECIKAYNDRSLCTTQEMVNLFRTRWSKIASELIRFLENGTIDRDNKSYVDAYQKLKISRESRQQSSSSQSIMREIKVTDEPPATIEQIKALYPEDTQIRHQAIKNVLDTLHKRQIPFSIFATVDKEVRDAFLEKFVTEFDLNGNITAYGPLHELMNKANVTFEQIVFFKAGDKEKAKLIIKFANSVNKLCIQVNFKFELFEKLPIEKIRLILCNKNALYILKTNNNALPPKFLTALPYDYLLRVTKNEQDFLALKEAIPVDNRLNRNEHVRKLELLNKLINSLHANGISYFDDFEKLTDKEKECLFADSQSTIKMIDLKFSLQDILTLFTNNTEEANNSLAYNLTYVPEFVKDFLKYKITPNLLHQCPESLLGFLNDSKRFETMMKLTQTEKIVTVDEQFNELIRVHSSVNSTFFQKKIYLYFSVLRQEQLNFDYTQFLDLKMNLEELVTLFKPDFCDWDYLKNLVEKVPGILKKISKEQMRVFIDHSREIDSLLESMPPEMIITTHPQIMETLAINSVKVSHDFKAKLDPRIILEKYSYNILTTEDGLVRVLKFEDKIPEQVFSKEETSNKTILQKSENAEKFAAMQREVKMSEEDLLILPSDKLQLIINNSDKVIKILNTKGKTSVTLRLLMNLTYAELSQLLNIEWKFKNFIHYILDFIEPSICEYSSKLKLFRTIDPADGTRDFLSFIEKISEADKEIILRENNTNLIYTMIESRFPLKGIMDMLIKYKHNQIYLESILSVLKKYPAFAKKAIELQVPPEEVCKIMFLAESSIKDTAEHSKIKFLNYPNSLEKLMNLLNPNLSSTEKLNLILFYSIHKDITSILFNIDAIPNNKNLTLEDFLNISYWTWKALSEIIKLAPELLTQVTSDLFKRIVNDPYSVTKLLTSGMPPDALLKLSPNGIAKLFNYSTMARVLAELACKDPWDAIVLSLESSSEMSQQGIKRKEPSAGFTS